MPETHEAPTPPFQIQKLGHIVLNCSDLDRAIEFYTQILGFKLSDRYPEDLVPGGMAFLRCGTDHHSLALVGGMQDDQRVELNHFAWEVASIEEVFAARQFLREHEVPIHFEGRRRAGCQIAVEFKDPDGNNVEIYWNVDQVGSNGYVRPPSEWRQALTLEDAVANPPPGQIIRNRQAYLKLPG
jgi:catechol 2,3-dioxygenase-like lactoylglutathione lyase family enzyme